MREGAPEWSLDNNLLIIINVMHFSGFLKNNGSTNSVVDASTFTSIPNFPRPRFRITSRSTYR